MKYFRKIFVNIYYQKEKLQTKHISIFLEIVLTAIWIKDQHIIY